MEKRKSFNTLWSPAERSSSLTSAPCQVADLKQGGKLTMTFYIKWKLQVQERDKSKRFLGTLEKACDTQLCRSVFAYVCVCSPPTNSMFWSTSVSSGIPMSISHYWLQSLLCNTGMLEVDHLTKPQICTSIPYQDIHLLSANTYENLNLWRSRTKNSLQLGCFLTKKVSSV